MQELSYVFVLFPAVFFSCVTRCFRTGMYKKPEELTPDQKQRSLRWEICHAEQLLAEFITKHTRTRVCNSGMGSVTSLTAKCPSSDSRSWKRAWMGSTGYSLNKAQCSHEQQGRMCCRVSCSTSLPDGGHTRVQFQRAHHDRSIGNMTCLGIGRSNNC